MSDSTEHPLFGSYIRPCAHPIDTVQYDIAGWSIFLFRELSFLPFVDTQATISLPLFFQMQLSTEDVMPSLAAVGWH